MTSPQVPFALPICTIPPSSPVTPLTDAEALAFVQRQRPVGLVRIGIRRLVIDQDHPFGVAYVNAQWKPYPTDQRLKFNRDHGSRIEEGRQTLVYVVKRSTGTVFAQSYAMGDPWLVDWCRPLEDNDTIQDDPIPDDIEPCDSKCCQPTLAWFQWMQDSIKGLYPDDPSDTIDQGTCPVLPLASPLSVCLA